MDYQEFNNDQRREKVNSDQRFAAWQQAKAKVRSFRGSMVWQEAKGEEYLARSYYDFSGIRKQKSLGRRSRETEKLKEDWERGRDEAKSNLKNMQDVMSRQAAVNRALMLGRMPMSAAKIIRVLDEVGLLGQGIRVVGTNAIYAYEAAAGVFVNPGIMATNDIDLLMDARQSLRVMATDDIGGKSLLSLLQKTDKSFVRSSQEFRAVNRDGYLVDLIRPQRNPPWISEREQVGNDDADLTAAPIEGLSWHESAPSFEAVVFDERGGPLRVVATDPRVFAAHKLWVSKQQGRDALKRKRDEDQARVVAKIVATYMSHLEFDRDELKMVPSDIFEEVAPLFEVTGTGDEFSF